jgi:hypothetical protein
MDVLLFVVGLLLELCSKQILRNLVSLLSMENPLGFSDLQFNSQREIVSLYERFCALDRTGKGFISADEFMGVPEFAVNPLCQVCMPTE